MSDTHMQAHQPQRSLTLAAKNSPLQSISVDPNHRFDKETAIEAAIRFAALAESQEATKNYQAAQESNKNASIYYLEAKAYLKQRPDCDHEALKTIEILSETHKRKAKLLNIRQSQSIDSVKDKVNQMMQEQEKLKKGKDLTEQEKQAKLEREKYMEKMKEQLIVINNDIYSDAKKSLETLVEYQKTKLEKFEARFIEILNIFKKAFNEQTKELILSHGEKFISVQNNPFAKDAMRESISISKIEKNNQKLEKLLDVLKKFRNMMDERLSKVVQKMDDLQTKDKSFQLNYAQMTALATTQVGQAIGMNNLFGQDSVLIEELQRQTFNQDLLDSMFQSNRDQLNSSQQPFIRGNQEMGEMPNQHSVYVQQIQKMEKEINKLTQENEDLSRKYKKYYKFTKQHLEKIQEIQKKQETYEQQEKQQQDSQPQSKPQDKKDL